MRNLFDQLGKTIGLEALGPSGRTVAHDEIAPDAHHADLRHDPDPARDTERARLGLLGRLASVLCLIEVYSGAPGEDETLACLGKLIAFRQKRRRDARKQRKRPSPASTFTKPFLWIITAGRPTTVLDELGAAPSPAWPPGVYFSPALFRAGIVVASELPRERSTLLVRLVAAGPLLPHAIDDLGALPADAHERAVAAQILLRLRETLGGKPHRTREEQEFIMSTQDIVEKLRDEGRLTQGRAVVRRVLALRGLATSAADEARIDGCADLATLDRWLDRAVTAQSAAEALADGGARRGRKGPRSS